MSYIFYRKHLFDYLTISMFIYYLQSCKKYLYMYSYIYDNNHKRDIVFEFHIQICPILYSNVLFF